MYVHERILSDFPISTGTPQFNRDKTSTEEASKLFSRDLFTYAKEHKLLEPILVTDEQLDAIHAGTATTTPAPSVSAAAIDNP